MSLADAVLVPLKSNPSQFVELPDEVFSDDSTPILMVLESEKPPIDVWWRCALKFRRKGLVDAYEKITKLFDVDREQALPVPVRTPEDKKVMVAMANSLASHYIHQAHLEKDNKRREDLYTGANRLFNRADKADPRFPLTLLGKALFHLYRRTFDKARQNVKLFLEKVPDSKVGRIIESIIDFQESKVDSSLETLSAVMTDRFADIASAGAPSESIVAATATGAYSNIRPAIAHLWASLRNPERAVLALRRQRLLTPTHEGTLVSLGTLLLNQYNAELAKYNADVATGQPSQEPNPKLQSNGLNLISQAFSANSLNARAANLLSHHTFLAKYNSNDDEALNRASNLANRAYTVTKDPHVRSEAAYFRGRLSHARGDLNDAHAQYSESVRLWEDFPLGNFGLGQTLIARREYAKAIVCFERVLRRAPDNFESLKMLGSLQRETGNFDAAESFLFKAQKIRPNDAEVALELAIVLERRDPIESCKQYDLALRFLHDISRQTSIPPELWNNAGVIRQRVGNILGARDAFVRSLISVALLEPNQAPAFLLQRYQELLQRRSSEFLSDTEFSSLWVPDTLCSDSLLLRPASLSTAFNMAVFFEETTDLPRATELYRRIVGAQPQYVDCWIRLGSIAQQQGHFSQASDYFKEVVAVSTQHSGAWTMLANLHMEKHEYDAAQKIFDSMLQANKHDSYALVQYANLFLQAAQSNPDKKDRYLEKAEEWFSAVLKKDPNNVFAVNGLGIVLARRGLLTDARDMFATLEESLSSQGKGISQFGQLSSDVLTNLANIHFEQRNFHQAAILYEKALQKANQQTATDLLLPLLARSYYEDGKFEQARAVAAKACRAAPWKSDNWFNMALCMKDSAAKLINSNSSSLVLKSTALPLLQAAVPIFQLLEKPTTDKRVKYSLKKAATSLRLCNAQIGLLDDKIKALEEAESKEQAAKEARKRRFQEMEELQRLEEEKKRATEEAEQAELAKRYEEQEQLRQAILSRIEEEQQRQAEAEAAKARAVDDLIGDGDEAVGSRKRKPKKGGRKKKKSTASGEEDDSGPGLADLAAPADDADSGAAEPEQDANPEDALARLRRIRETRLRRTQVDEEQDEDDQNDSDADELDALFDAEDEEKSSRKRKRTDSDAETELQNQESESAAVVPVESSPKRQKTLVNEGGEDDLFPAEMQAEAEAMLAD